MFIVLQLEKTIVVEGMHGHVEIPLSWGKGMLGILPVFATEEEAREYTGGDGEIREIEYKEKNN